MWCQQRAGLDNPRWHHSCLMWLVSWGLAGPASFRISLQGVVQGSKRVKSTSCHFLRPRHPQPAQHHFHCILLVKTNHRPAQIKREEETPPLHGRNREEHTVSLSSSHFNFKAISFLTGVSTSVLSPLQPVPHTTPKGAFNTRNRSCLLPLFKMLQLPRTSLVVVMGTSSFHC